MDYTKVKLPDYDKLKLASIISSTGDNLESQIFSNTFKNIYNTTMVFSPSSTIDTIEYLFETIVSGVDTVIKRFPELEYLIDLFSSSVVYGTSDREIKISFVISNDNLKNKLEKKAALSEIEKYKLKEFKREYDDRLKEYILSIFNKNSISTNLLYITSSTYKYGISFVYFSKDYKTADFYSLKDVKIKYKYTNNQQSNALDPSDAAKEINKILSSNTNLDDIYNKFEFYNINGKKLVKDRLYVITNKGAFGKSVIKDTGHYFKILDILETSMVLERLSKTRTLHVWKVFINADEDEDSETLGLITLYKNIINSKSSIIINEDNTYNIDISKNMLDNHVLIPVFDKDAVSIETLKSEYKPILSDIEYYWKKIYYALGIPLHYRADISESKAVPTAAIEIHDNAYALKVKRYQTIISEMLKYWITKIFEVNGYQVERVNVALPKFTPISSKKETDLQKIDKLLNAIDILNTSIGIQLKKEFILNLIFPEYDPDDIIEKEIPPEASEGEVDLTTEGYNSPSEGENEITVDDILKELSESLIFKEIQEKKEKEKLYKSEIKIRYIID